MSLSLSFPAHAPDPLAELRRMLWNSLVSAHTKRAYTAAFGEFFALVAATGRPVSRALLMDYRAQLIDKGLSASTINVRLSAIRKLVSEARENGFLDPVEAARILTVPGVPTRGVRLGNWLTPEEAKRLLGVPDRHTLIGKRTFAILSVLVYCALRRDELARLEMRHIQRREGRWVISDLVGKRGRVRTVPIPDAAKAALDEWLEAAAIKGGLTPPRKSREKQKCSQLCKVMKINALRRRAVDLVIQLATSFMLTNFRYLLPVQVENGGDIWAAKRNLSTVVMRLPTNISS